MSKNTSAIKDPEARGIQALHQGEFARAVKLLRQALADNPDRHHLHHYLGIALFQSDALEASEQSLRDYLATAPEDLLALTNLGATLSRQGRLEDAADQYRAALDIDPTQAAAWRGLADCLVQRGRFEEAANAYEQAFEHGPEDLHSLMNYCNTLAMLGKKSRALTCFDTLIESAPDSAILYCNRASALLRWSRFQEAADGFNAALARDPDLPQAHLGLANALVKLVELDQAAHHARRALDLAPGENSWFRLGYVLQEQGEYLEASDCYQKVREINPSNAVATRNLGVIALNQGRLDEAERWLRLALQTDPSDADAWSDLANALEKQGDYPEAEIAARRGVEQRESPRTLIRLGYILQRMERQDEALDVFKRCLQIDPKDLQGVSLYLAGLGLSAIPEKASAEHVRSLFDHYAAIFDKHLLQTLAYTGPRKVLDALAPWLAEARPTESLEVLDLGCGTGLCGLALKPFAARMIGVDLSARMLAQAAKRDIYDRLVEEELQAYLDAEAQQYDLVTAADVLVYVGDLRPLFIAIWRCLRPGGAFAFTVERHEGPGYRMGTSARFTHGQGYLEALAAETGFRVLSLQETSTRQEADLPVMCLAVALAKPA